MENPCSKFALTIGRYVEHKDGRSGYIAGNASREDGVPFVQVRETTRSNYTFIGVTPTVVEALSPDSRYPESLLWWEITSIMNLAVSTSPQYCPQCEEIDYPFVGDYLCAPCRDALEHA